MSQTIEALNWVVLNGKRPAIFSASMHIPMRRPALTSAVNAAVSKGVVVIVAAGNQGGDSCKYSPARVPSAITVGAIDEKDNIASFSNAGKCVDVFAPGMGIYSTGVPPK